ncbi:hypothetical protein KKG71_05150, partial [Patescibacteria group bacterium]|nr:hypothetical protein [Patescibacteria group bacterium]
MQVRNHILASLPLLILYPFLGLKIIIIIIASIAIDIDHIYILIEEKNFKLERIKYLSDNIHRIYKKNPQTALKKIIYLFHTIELNILFIILSFWYPILIYVTAGFIFHIIFDSIH